MLFFAVTYCFIYTSSPDLRSKAMGIYHFFFHNLRN